jgi:hypothetical protein
LASFYILDLPALFLNKPITMQKTLPVFIALLFLYKLTIAQEPVIEWQKVYGTQYVEQSNFFDIQKTPDNGYVLFGAADRDGIYENARMQGGIGNPALIYKIDAYGNLQWKNAFSDNDNTIYNSGLQTAAGKFIGCGYFDDQSVFTGKDVLLAQVSSTGVLEWSKRLGGSGNDRAWSVAPTLDNGLVFAGYTFSTDGNVTGNHGGSDVWVGKCDLSGNLLWQKCLGGSASDCAYSIVQLTDGGYLVAGTTASTNGDVTSNAGDADAWVVKLDGNGNVVWQKTYGSSSFDEFRKIRLTADGGFIAIGSAGANTGIVTNNHGSADVWVVKCDNSGNLQWQKCYGGSFEDIGADVQPAIEGGYLLNCTTMSSNGDVRGTPSFMHDQWVVKIKDNGVLEWTKLISTPNDDAATAILPVDQYRFIAVENWEENSQLTQFGPLNTISGTVYVDVDGNGIKGAAEPFFNNGTVTSTRTDGYNRSSGLTNGAFTSNVDAGTYETKLSFLNANFTADPLSHTSTFPDRFGHDQVTFRLVPNGTINDVQVTLLPVNVARPGFSGLYKLNYKNVGTTALSNVVIELNLDAAGSAVLYTFPNYQSVTGNVYSWTISSLPVLGEGTIDITTQIQSPPQVNNGDTLKLIAKATLTVTENTPADNADTLRQITQGSFDPNDKTETHGGVITPAQLSGADPLTYVIRFQNTGTDTAFNVTVRDTLESRLDWSTLQMISSSHTYQLSIEDGNKLTWRFNDIKLPYSGIDEPNSHGYIAYNIKPKTTTPVGDTIKNKAGIYFDYNLPVITNAEKTVVMLLSSLPVTLTSFKAALKGDVVNVTWKTSLEENIKQFEIERSANGIDFTTIGKVQPGQSNYLFTDKQPLTGYNYYRLKSLDIDGAYKYSIVVLVNTKNETSIISSLYPNPGNGNIQLKLQGVVEGNVMVQVIDQQGRPIVSKQYGVQHTGEFKTPIVLNGLSKGTYVFRIMVNDKIYLHKLLIQ